MVATIQIVVDEDFPVAVDVVDTAFEIVQLADSEGVKAPHQASKEFAQAGCSGIQVHEDKLLPDVSVDRN